MKKKDIIKKIIITAAAAAAVFSALPAAAEILGEYSDGWTTDMGGGATYYHKAYRSSSVGKQTENYVEYTPNSEAVPIVVNGASVWGKRNITSAAQYMEDNGLRPLIGINADYFSTSTGIPMGYTIINGEIYSKEAGLQDAVGFRKDGTAFIDKIGIDTSVAHGDKKISVRYVNKWLQDGFTWVNLLTSDFDDNTHTKFKALYVICSKIDGSLALNSTMELNVDEVFVYDGAIKIPDGKYVFVMDVDGDEESYNMLSALAAGDTLSVSNSVWGAERYDWTEAEYAVSSIGGRLINNGALGGDFEKGAAPRTAVGVKADGTVVFYTLDGRQSNYSYGAQIATVAKRMQEIGCVDAINLDGGGSTAIGGVFPGTEIFEVRNRPSDGALRSCANYLFLQDNRAQTGEPWYVEWRELSNYNYLAGTGVQLEASKVYDTGNYRMDSLTGVEYSVENSEGASSTVDENGFVTLRGTGETNITVSGNSYSTSFKFSVFESPEEIRVADEGNGGEYKEIYINEGDMTNIDLEAQAYVNGVQLEAYPSLFKWELTGTLGSVDEDGTLSLKDDGSGSAVLHVTAGNVTADIPIYVMHKEKFDDISGHWAHETIEEMAADGIINGIEQDGTLLFKPDSSITRIQFAAIICNAMGVNPNEYADKTADYTDSGEIQPWATNYVKAAAALGYMTGRSDDDGKTTYFAPESNITRAEAFAVISRIIEGDASKTISYADSDEIQPWAKGAFEKLSALGIIEGFEDNTIKPNGLTTRAEAAALIKKALAVRAEG